LPIILEKQTWKYVNKKSMRIAWLLIHIRNYLEQVKDGLEKDN